MFLPLKEVEELTYSCSFLGLETDEGLDSLKDLNFPGLCNQRVDYLTMDLADLCKLHKRLDLYLLSGFKLVMDVVACSAWRDLEAILGLDLKQCEDRI